MNSKSKKLTQQVVKVAAFAGVAALAGYLVERGIKAVETRNLKAGQIIPPQTGVVGKTITPTVKNLLQSNAMAGVGRG